MRLLYLHQNGLVWVFDPLLVVMVQMVYYSSALVWWVQGWDEPVFVVQKIVEIGQLAV